MNCSFSTPHNVSLTCQGGELHGETCMCGTTQTFPDAPQPSCNVKSPTAGGASIVVQWVKLPPVKPTSHTRAPMGILDTSLPVLLPATAPSKAVEDGPRTWPVTYLGDSDEVPGSWLRLCQTLGVVRQQVEGLFHIARCLSTKQIEG